MSMRSGPFPAVSVALALIAGLSGCQGVGGTVSAVVFPAPPFPVHRPDQAPQGYPTSLRDEDRSALRRVGVLVVSARPGAEIVPGRTYSVEEALNWSTAGAAAGAVGLGAALAAGPCNPAFVLTPQIYVAVCGAAIITGATMGMYAGAGAGSVLYRESLSESGSAGRFPVARGDAGRYRPAALESSLAPGDTESGLLALVLTLGRSIADFTVVPLVGVAAAPGMALDYRKIAESTPAPDTFLELGVHRGFFYGDFSRAEQAQSHRVFVPVRVRIIRAADGATLADEVLTHTSKESHPPDTWRSNNGALYAAALADAHRALAFQIVHGILAGSPATAPVAMAALPADPAEGSTLPASGAIFRYRWSDDRSSTGRRDFSIRVDAVDGWRVSEAFTVEGTAVPAVSAAIPALDLAFVARDLRDGASMLELAPYLPIAHPPGAPGLNRKLRLPDDAYGEWTVTMAVRVWDEVSVPAGHFRALRVIVRGYRYVYAPAGAPADSIAGRFEYTAWYAPDAGRYVKAHHLAWNVLRAPIRDDRIELVELRRPPTR